MLIYIILKNDKCPFCLTGVWSFAWRKKKGGGGASKRANCLILVTDKTDLFLY